MKKLGLAAAFCAAFASAPQAVQAQEMMGTLTLFAGDYCPRGYIAANGSLLPVQSYSALFSIMGTRYGGDGRSTFAVPDLRGRAPVHKGALTGGGDIKIGQKMGVRNVTLTTENLPAHSHDTEVDLMATTNTQGRTKTPAGNLIAATSGAAFFWPPFQGAENLVEMAPDSLRVKDQKVGNSKPVLVQSPILAMTYCVNTSGVYPSR